MSFKNKKGSAVAVAVIVFVFVFTLINTVLPYLRRASYEPVTLEMSGEEVVLLGQYVPELYARVSWASFDSDGYLSVVCFGGHDGYSKELKSVCGSKYPYVETQYGVLISVEGWTRPDGTRPHKDEFIVAKLGDVEDFQTIYLCRNGVFTEAVALNVAYTSFEVMVKDVNLVRAGDSGTPVVVVDEAGDYYLVGYICAGRSEGSAVALAQVPDYMYGTFTA